MTTKTIVVTNTVGLHARPATLFIQKANEYRSSLWIERGDRRVNAKSLLGVLSLGITKDTEIGQDGLQQSHHSSTKCGYRSDVGERVDNGTADSSYDYGRSGL